MIRNQIVIVIFFLIIAALPRLFYLGKIPVSMSDDEVRLVYNAYSIWETGKDINGRSFPLAFLVSGYAFNPVPIYIISPFVGLLGLNMVTSRLPFAIAGIITVILLYPLTKNLLKSKFIATFSTLAFAFSVWHLQLSRFAYEGVFALLFSVSGILTFLSIQKGKFFALILSMVFFLFTFYSYSGIKIILLPMIGILIWYKYNELNFKQLLFTGFAVFAILVSFIYLSRTQNAASYGQGQFFFQETEVAANAVEIERRASWAPEILKRMYHNKFTYWSRIFLDHYTYAFSPQYLFTSQEGNGIFSIWSRGQMYYIEAPLLILGLIYLFYKKRKETILLLLFLTIAPLPSGLGPEPITYTIRSSFMLPWLMILVGAGIYSIYYFLQNRKLMIVLYACLISSYIYLIGGYLTQYYFEWPRYGAKYYAKAAQDLVSLVNKEKQTKKLIIISPASSMVLLHYAFYNRLFPSITQELYRKDPLKFENIILEKNCPDFSQEYPLENAPIRSLLIVSFDCATIYENLDSIKPSYSIKSPEGENEFFIYEN